MQLPGAGDGWPRPLSQRDLLQYGVHCWWSGGPGEGGRAVWG